ncbi:kazrin isoform X2 [Delphinapterus leucas]|uniref:Kazrin n=1 Tax=Delphinapterus leucas TaxID=9749 RepID=A0A2Y9Q9C0_DELLE|nr:kazrin isoform X2 [Delphinapterus leucas]
MTNTKDPRRAMESTLATSSSATGPVTFSHVFGQQCQLMEAAVQSLHTLNDQISHFIVTKSKALEEDQDPFLPTEKETLKSSMMLMRHLLMDAQAKILSMMEDNKQLALRIDGAVQSASQEMTNLRAELTATNRRLAELSGGGGGPGPGPGAAASASAAADSAAANMENHQHSAQAMKADRKRLKGEKTDLVSQMQQLYATLESREEQLRDFIRNYEQHRKESEDAVKALAKEKDLLEREKWELRRQAKEATDHATALRSQLDLKDNRMKELEAELAMAKQSLATLTKDVPKRHSLAMPGETVLNGNQEWVVQADLPLTAAIRQSQQTLYHSHPPHPGDRQAVRVSPCHSRQPSVISDASAAEGDRSSTPSDINSPRHRTHSLCNGDSPGPVQKNLHNPIVQSLEDLEDQKRKKKKEKMGFGSISRVFARGKQRKSLDPGLFDDSDSQCSPTRQSLSLSEGEEQTDRLQQVELVRTTPMSHWKAGTVQAWLEVVMAMPMYVKACAENVKSGKVLLSLSDEDLELGLGVCSSLHRRKLRLAIEDYRDAEAGRSLSKAADLDHHWVAKAWLNDIGLSQYSQAFQNHLVDGRMLNSLMKRDLEKHLNVSKKFHQISILLGIELLYQVNFSREALQERRARCETQNIDPVVWTNQRVLKWVRDIDLKEYADNLTNSGVHGAVLVLEPTFNAEAMATALGIPSGKHILRRHLAEEMSAIFHPANSTGIREAERFGTPPGRASSITRAGKEENSGGIKYKAGRLPLGKIGRGFSSKDPDFHDDYGSLQNEDCGDDDSQGRPEQCRLEGYNGLEVTNV